MTDKLSVQPVCARARRTFLFVCAQDGTRPNFAFHGVPGGHELTSVCTCLYNAAGPGQPISDEIRHPRYRARKDASAGLGRTFLYHVPRRCCSCSCIADNPWLPCDVYDINHFKGAFKDTYDVMSVPFCLVINDGQKVDFGVSLRFCR